MGPGTVQACDAFRDALRKGTLLGAEQQRHAAECELCAELLAYASAGRRMVHDLASLPAVGSEWGPSVPLPPARPWQRLEGARLGVRRGLALAATAGVALVVGLVWLRPDFAAYSPRRYAVELAVLGATCALAIWNLLEPPQRGVPTRAQAWSAAAALSCLPFVLVLGAPVHLSHAASLVQDPAHLARSIGACLAVGAGFGALTYGLLALVDRGGLGAAMPVAQRAVASGLLGVVVLHLHCPITHAVHVAVGHSAVPSIGAAVLVAWVWLRRRPSWAR